MKPLVGSFSQEKVEERTWSNDGDHERYAHYAPADEVTRAIVTGIPVVALCGKVWVPHRDPKNYQICPTCKEIHEGLNE